MLVQWYKSNMYPYIKKDMTAAETSEWFQGKIEFLQGHLEDTVVEVTRERYIKKIAECEVFRDHWRDLSTGDRSSPVCYTNYQGP